MGAQIKVKCKCGKEITIKIKTIDDLKKANQLLIKQNAELRSKLSTQKAMYNLKNSFNKTFDGLDDELNDLLGNLGK